MCLLGLLRCLANGLSAEEALLRLPRQVLMLYAARQKREVLKLR